MRKFVRIAMLALAPALALAAEPGWLNPDRAEPAGTHYKTFSSSLAGGDASYLIYLPPDYETAPARRYPVVYWLHGLNGDQKGGAPFVKQLDGAIRNGQAPAMIAVLVNGTKDSFYCDSPDGKWPVESMIVKELIPHIDRTYRTLARREARAVEGYSMGGYGAAHLGFQYPDLFGVVGVMAGALIRTETFTGGQQAIFRKMFGGEIARMEASDPFTIVRKNADAIRGRTAVRVAVGDLDSLQMRDQAFHELLRELKIEHEYEVVPGVAHNGALFYATLGERAFAYYAKAFAPHGPQAPLPGRIPNAAGQSRVLQRGDLEILTYETEQDYEHLGELYKSQPASPEPGKLTPVICGPARTGLCSHTPCVCPTATRRSAPIPWWSNCTG